MKKNLLFDIGFLLISLAIFFLFYNRAINNYRIVSELITCIAIIIGLLMIKFAVRISKKDSSPRKVPMNKRERWIYCIGLSLLSLPFPFLFYRLTIAIYDTIFYITFAISIFGLVIIWVTLLLFKYRTKKSSPKAP